MTTINRKYTLKLRTFAASPCLSKTFLLERLGGMNEKSAHSLAALSTPALEPRAAVTMVPASRFEWYTGNRTPRVSNQPKTSESRTTIIFRSAGKTFIHAREGATSAPAFESRTTLITKPAGIVKCDARWWW